MHRTPVRLRLADNLGMKVMLLVLLLLNVAVLRAQTYTEGERAYLAGDYARALEILTPLAERGNSDAQALLGLMYDHGQGVSRDPQQAVEWYTRAAEQGVAAAQHDLGVKYFQGKGVRQDYSEAARWWQRAAEAGQADSQFNLGLMYYHGQGMPQDYERAAGLFRQAAEQGYASAQYTLAIMYATGQGMPRDYASALPLFRAAAEQGYAQAQYNLGVFYENGHGVARDLDRARHWYRKAAAQGVALARERLEKLPADRSAGREPAAMPPPAAGIALTEGAQENTTAAGTGRPVPPVTTGQPAAGAAPAGGRCNQWLKQQSPGKLTIQLLSTTDEAAARQYLHDRLPGVQACYVTATIEGRRRFNIVVGAFDNRAAAERAVSGLPASVRNGQQPWIRNIGLLQQLVQ